MSEKNNSYQNLNNIEKHIYLEKINEIYSKTNINEIEQSYLIDFENKIIKIFKNNRNEFYKLFFNSIKNTQYEIINAIIKKINIVKENIVTNEIMKSLTESAIIKGNFSIFETLFDKYLDGDAIIDINNLFSLVCKYGDEYKVEYLINYDIDFEKYNFLNLACKNKSSGFGIARILLNNNKNININTVDKNGNTPLDIAIENNQIKIIKLLIDQPDINENIKDSIKKFSKKQSQNSSKQDIEEIIINLKTKNILIFACIYNYEDIFFDLYEEEYSCDIDYNISLLEYTTGYKENSQNITNFLIKVFLKPENLKNITKEQIEKILNCVLKKSKNPNPELVNLLLDKFKEQEIKKANKNEIYIIEQMYDFNKNGEIFDINFSENESEENEVNQININRKFNYNNEINKLTIIDEAYKDSKIIYKIEYLGNNKRKITYYEKDNNKELTTLEVNENNEINFLNFAGNNLKTLKEKINKIFKANENLNEFDENFSYLAYAPIKLQQNQKNEENKEELDEKIVLKICHEDTKFLKNTLIESLEYENKNKLFICDFCHDQHNVQTIISNGNLTIINTGYEFKNNVVKEIKRLFINYPDKDRIKISEFKSMEQSTGNCVLASKLYTSELITDFKENNKYLLALPYELNKLEKNYSKENNKTEILLTAEKYEEDLNLLKEILKLNYKLYKNNIENFNRISKRFVNLVINIEKKMKKQNLQNPNLEVKVKEIKNITTEELKKQKKNLELKNQEKIKDTSNDISLDYKLLEIEDLISKIQEKDINSSSIFH